MVVYCKVSLKVSCKLLLELPRLSQRPGKLLGSSRSEISVRVLDGASGEFDVSAKPFLSRGRKAWTHHTPVSKDIFQKIWPPGNPVLEGQRESFAKSK
jgi:hypothetical protein